MSTCGSAQIARDYRSSRTLLDKTLISSRRSSATWRPVRYRRQQGPHRLLSTSLQLAQEAQAPATLFQLKRAVCADPTLGARSQRSFKVRIRGVLRANGTRSLTSVLRKFLSCVTMTALCREAWVGNVNCVSAFPSRTAAAKRN